MNFWLSDFVAGSHVHNIKGRKLLSLTISTACFAYVVVRLLCIGVVNCLNTCQRNGLPL